MKKKGGEKTIIGRRPKIELHKKYLTNDISNHAQKLINDRNEQIEKLTNFLEIVEKENVKLHDEKQILLEEIRRLKNGS